MIRNLVGAASAAMVGLFGHTLVAAKAAPTVSSQDGGRSALAPDGFWSHHFSFARNAQRLISWDFFRGAKPVPLA